MIVTCTNHQFRWRTQQAVCVPRRVSDPNGSSSESNLVGHPGGAGDHSKPDAIEQLEHLDALYITLSEVGRWLNFHDHASVLVDIESERRRLN